MSGDSAYWPRPVAAEPCDAQERERERDRERDRERGGERERKREERG